VQPQNTKPQSTSPQNKNPQPRGLRLPGAPSRVPIRLRPCQAYDRHSLKLDCPLTRSRVESSGWVGRAYSVWHCGPHAHTPPGTTAPQTRKSPVCSGRAPVHSPAPQPLSRRQVRRPSEGGGRHYTEGLCGGARSARMGPKPQASAPAHDKRMRPAPRSQVAGAAYTLQHTGAGSQPSRGGSALLLCVPRLSRHSRAGSSTYCAPPCPATARSR
jgi:hypothetical protein